MKSAYRVIRLMLLLENWGLCVTTVLDLSSRFFGTEISLRSGCCFEMSENIRVERRIRLSINWNCSKEQSDQGDMMYSGQIFVSTVRNENETTRNCNLP